MRPVADSDLPSRAQIAVVKARAFGRRIINQSIAFARQLGLVEHDENKPTSPPPFALQNFSTCDYKVEEALDSNAALETEAALVEREHCNKAAKSSYCINSGTSSIGTKKGRVNYLQLCARKMLLALTPAGRAISALWRMKASGLTAEAVSVAMCDMNRHDRTAFCNAMRWMPAWMSDIVYQMHNPDD